VAEGFDVHDSPGQLWRSCWKCKTAMDGHARIGGDGPALPKDGDLAVCAYCAAPGVYEGEAIRKLTHDEFAEVMRDVRFRAVYDSVRMSVAMRS
jgi:hypothetical protein